MAFVDVEWKPADRQLRQFGVIALVALPLLGWLFSGKPWPGEVMREQGLVIGGLAALGFVAAALAAIRPQALRWPFIGATLAGVTHRPGGERIVLWRPSILALFFPVSIIFRLMGRDALERRIDRNAKSYWQPKVRPAGPESYFRQS